MDPYLSLYFTILFWVGAAAIIIVGGYFTVCWLVDIAPEFMRYVGYGLLGLLACAYVALLIFSAVV